MGEMAFYLKDVYGIGAVTTSEETIPESDDKEVFEENPTPREKVKANTGGATTKSIFSAFLIIVVVAFLLGAK